MLEYNNNSILQAPSQQQQHQGMLAPSSVVEYQAALHAQQSYEKLCGSAYETQCYGHFFWGIAIAKSERSCLQKLKNDGWRKLSTSRMKTRRY